MQTRFSPRRHEASPCNSLSTSPSTPVLQQKKVPSHRIRIEVHAGVNLTKNLADGPIHTIHNVNSKENLSTIKKLVREKVPHACFRAGFYWLQPKQTKPLHTLLCDNDLETAKDAYRDDITGMVKVLRLATVIQSGRYNFISFYFIDKAQYLYDNNNDNNNCSNSNYNNNNIYYSYCFPVFTF